MKKIITTLLTVLMTAAIMSGISMISHAETIDKSNIENGSIVDVVKYDASSNTFTYGTIKVQMQSRSLPSGNKQYLCFIDNTFKSTDGEIPALSKEKVLTLNSIVDETLKERISLGQASKGAYGNIDSEAATHISCISTFVMPKCEEKGISADEYMWLSVGDNNGNILRTYLNITESDKNPTPANSVTIKTVLPRKMSIRLEDGTILKQDSQFTLPIDKEVKFQMCSNNWDNDTYDDNGNGLAGTVVYKFIVSSAAKKNSYDKETHTFTICKADKVLRTDVNSCFMAYRFYFSNGNYNKQTGIENVVKTPVESLSVNLPLGSTIKADAYTGMKYQFSKNVFIQNDKDMTKSYTDYYWNSGSQVLADILAAAKTTTARCSALTSEGRAVISNAGINLDTIGIKYWYADTGNGLVYVSMEEYNNRNTVKPYNFYIVFDSNNNNFSVIKYDASQNNIPENYLKRDSYGPFSTYEEALIVYNTCK